MKKIIVVLIIIGIFLCTFLAAYFVIGLNDWYSTDIEVKQISNELGTTEFSVYLSQKEGYFKNPTYVLSNITCDDIVTMDKCSDSITETSDSVRYVFNFGSENNYMTYYSKEKDTITVNDDFNTCDKELKYQESWINTIEKSGCFSDEQIKYLGQYLEFYEQNILKLSPENISLVRG